MKMNFLKLLKSFYGLDIKYKIRQTMGMLKTINTPIVSDIKTSSLETKTEQREQE